MSDDKKINISIMPEAIDTILENMFVKPSQCVGQTFEDAWELTIGNRLHYSRKKQEYNFEKKLKMYRKEIEEEIDKIDANKRAEPDFQTISIILQDSEFGIEYALIRKMFARLVASTMDMDVKEHVHPIFGHILKHMNGNDAVVFEIIALGHTEHLTEINSRIKVEFSVRVLLQLGVIKIGRGYCVKNPLYGNVDRPQSIMEYDEYISNLLKGHLESLLSKDFELTEIGKMLADIVYE